MKISLSSVKDMIQVFRRKPLKEIFFGKKVQYTKEEQELLAWIKDNPQQFKREGGRKGDFIRKDLVHKGAGTVYLLSRRPKQSILLFDEKVTIRTGPDLYVYLSTEKDARKGLGDILNLGLLKGTKGGQSYAIKQPLQALERYQSVVIYCKAFEELFTFAALS